MEQLQELRKAAEDTFNTLQTSLNSIKAELQKYGLETLDDGYAELNRLQGEFRALNKALESLPKDKKTPKANIIDATEVDPKETK